MNPAIDATSPLDVLFPGLPDRPAPRIDDASSIGVGRFPVLGAASVAAAGAGTVLTLVSPWFAVVLIGAVVLGFVALGRERPAAVAVLGLAVSGIGWAMVAVVALIVAGTAPLAGHPAPRSAPLGITSTGYGATWTWSDGLAARVSPPRPYSPSGMTVPPGTHPVLVTVTLTNGTDEAFVPSAYGEVSSAGERATELAMPAAEAGRAHRLTVIPVGGSATWKEVWAVADAADVRYRFGPDHAHDSVDYRGPTVADSMRIRLEVGVR